MVWQIGLKQAGYFTSMNFLKVKLFVKYLDALLHHLDYQKDKNDAQGSKANMILLFSN